MPRDEDRPRWEQLQKNLAGVRTQIQERKNAAKEDFEKWLASVQPADLAKFVPTDALALHAPLDEGEGSLLKVSVAGSPRELALGEGYTWGMARNEKNALSLQPGPVFAAPYQLGPDEDPALDSYARASNPGWRALESALAELEGAAAARVRW